MTNRDAILSPENLGSDAELLIAVLKLASMISRPMREGVATPHGLSINELRVLMCVGGEGPVAGHDIAETMSIPPMNVSRALAGLDNRGWVKRADNEDNRRRRPVELSEAGWAALGSLIPDVNGIAQYVFSPIRKSERDRLLDIVNRINGRIEGWPFRDNTGSGKKRPAD